tara:strand:+ start:401 stop:694 length:294 start_codon:yes stop_codon:yes gene_type:complete
MDSSEITVRKYYDLPLEGNMCKKCLVKYKSKYRIDQLLHMNSKAQSQLGTDSTPEEREKALHVAMYVKESIMAYDKTRAENMFPEIKLFGDDNTSED